tara:strand:- start:2053 stop:2472 length:420 start_codon:yes stop_codon:yes gene_type:complete
MSRFENIKPCDLKIDSWRSSPESAWVPSRKIGVRVTHLPTGIVVESEKFRSQHKNRADAFGKLKDKLDEIDLKSSRHSFIKLSRKAFEAGIIKLAEERDYQFMDQLLRTDDSDYLTSWVSAAWMGWCMAMKQQAKDGKL